MGVYVTGPYLGGLMALAITNSVVMPMVNGNWRGVMVVYGGLVLISGLIWILVSYLQEAQLSAFKGGRKYNLSAFTEILDVRQVRLILIMSVGIFFINHGLNN